MGNLPKKKEGEVFCLRLELDFKACLSFIQLLQMGLLD